MSGFRSSSWKGDPINRPDQIPLDVWYSFHLKMVATCRCGRVAVVNTGTLIKRFGYGESFDARRLALLSLQIKCIRCGAKEPKLTLEVRRD